MEMYMLLSGSKAEVYDIVLDSLYYEVSQSSNKKINKSSLKKGFKHTNASEKRKAYSWLSLSSDWTWSWKGL